MEGKVLVNVGKGDLVDQKAQYEALCDGILKGAAIDCWFRYPEKGRTQNYPSDYPIHEFDNVVLSLHVTGFTTGSSEKNIEEVFENIRSDLKHEIDLSSGY